MESWEKEFFDLTKSLNSHSTDLEINRSVWRINEASMYLSRLVQYRNLGANYEVDPAVMELLTPIGVLCSQLSRYLQVAEIEFVEKAELTNQEYCLECIENNVLTDWGDHEPDE